MAWMPLAIGCPKPHLSPASPAARSPSMPTTAFQVSSTTPTAIRWLPARSFTYDFENRVKAMTMGATTVTLQYDGDGNRVAKNIGSTTTRYLVAELNPTGDPQVVEEVVNGAVQRTYTYGLQRISQYQPINSTWTASYYGYDGMGSVRFLTDATGAVTDRYDYDAWGNPVNVTGTTPNVYLYRGEQYDPDLTLYYLRARYFNPLSGRFLTKDQATGETTEPFTFHKYLYTRSNPVNLIDPRGWADIGDCKGESGCGGMVGYVPTTTGYLAGYWGKLNILPQPKLTAPKRCEPISGAGFGWLLGGGGNLGWGKRPAAAGAGSYGGGTFVGGGQQTNGTFGSAGGFWNTSAGSASYPPGQSGSNSNQTYGLGAGVGAGLFFTNAGNATALGGPFN